MLIRIREAIADWVFSSEDFRAGELVTHGQSCIWLTGSSALANALLSKDALGNPIDVHSMLAASILNVDYETFIKNKKLKQYANTRQASKPPNFGYPGGMGDFKLVAQQRKQGPDTQADDGPSEIRVGDDIVPGFKGLRFCIVMDGARFCGMDDRGVSNKVTSWGRRDRIPPTCSHCLDCAARLKKMWKKQWPENDAYFRFIDECVEYGMPISGEALERWPWLQEHFVAGQRLAPGEIMQHFSGRIRQVATSTTESPFCSAANGFFQGLLAEAAKAAHRQCVRECYDTSYRVPTLLFDNSLVSQYAGIRSPLFGHRIPVFQHDEVIGHHPRAEAHEGATRISEVMRDCLRYMCRDVADAADAEPTLMEKWLKGAEKVVHKGRLVPWTPGHSAKNCNECQETSAVATLGA